MIIMISIKMYLLNWIDINVRLGLHFGSVQSDPSNGSFCRRYMNCCRSVSIWSDRNCGPW